MHYLISIFINARDGESLFYLLILFMHFTFEQKGKKVIISIHFFVMDHAGCSKFTKESDFRTLARLRIRH